MGPEELVRLKGLRTSVRKKKKKENWKILNWDVGRTLARNTINLQRPNHTWGRFVSFLFCFYPQCMILYSCCIGYRMKSYANLHFYIWGHISICFNNISLYFSQIWKCACTGSFLVFVLEFVLGKYISLFIKLAKSHIKWVRLHKVGSEIYVVTWFRLDSSF